MLVCPARLSRHQSQPQLPKETDKAVITWPGPAKGLAVHAWTDNIQQFPQAGLQHTPPFLHQNHLWPRSILPAAEARKAPGHTGKDSEEKLLIPHAVEEKRSSREDFDHKRTLITKSLAFHCCSTCSLQPSRESLAQDPDCALEFPGLKTANYDSQRQWRIWEWIHQSVVEMKLAALQSAWMCGLRSWVNAQIWRMQCLWSLFWNP